MTEFKNEILHAGQNEAASPNQDPKEIGMEHQEKKLRHMKSVFRKFPLGGWGSDRQKDKIVPDEEGSIQLWNAYKEYLKTYGKLPDPTYLDAIANLTRVEGMRDKVIDLYQKEVIYPHEDFQNLLQERINASTEDGVLNVKQKMLAAYVTRLLVQVFRFRNLICHGYDWSEDENGEAIAKNATHVEHLADSDLKSVYEKIISELIAILKTIAYGEERIALNAFAYKGEDASEFFYLEKVMNGAHDAGVDPSNLFKEIQQIAERGECEYIPLIDCIQKLENTFRSGEKMNDI